MNRRQCERLARVRTIQHGLAAAVSKRAALQVQTLEASSSQLASLREGFGNSQGTISGAALASLGEIAMRLDLARLGLSQSITGARAQASKYNSARLDARRNQESAERLTEKAATHAERRAERKQGERPSQRRRHDDPEGKE